MPKSRVKVCKLFETFSHSWDKYICANSEMKSISFYKHKHDCGKHVTCTPTMTENLFIAGTDRVGLSIKFLWA